MANLLYELHELLFSIISCQSKLKFNVKIFKLSALELQVDFERVQLLAQ